jgi:aminopeptidase N
MLLRARTGTDDAFLSILREFLSRYRGGFPATRDLREVVERQTAEDWSWFFDTWIYRAEIPTYLWSYDVSEEPSGTVLHLKIEPRDTSAGAAMEIPVRVELADGSQQTLLVLVDGSARSFRFDLPARPEKLVFDPDRAVLARAKQR